MVEPELYKLHGLVKDYKLKVNGCGFIGMDGKHTSYNDLDGKVLVDVRDDFSGNVYTVVGYNESPFHWCGPNHTLTLAGPSLVVVGCQQFRKLPTDRQVGHRHYYSVDECDLYLKIMAIAFEESERRWPNSGGTS